jgi:hypothetical protein
MRFTVNGNGVAALAQALGQLRDEAAGPSNLMEASLRAQAWMRWTMTAGRR